MQPAQKNRKFILYYNKNELNSINRKKKKKKKLTDYVFDIAISVKIHSDME